MGERLAAETSDRSQQQPSPSSRSPDPRAHRWLRLGAGILVAIGLALAVRSFVVQTFSIPSASMSPTLEPGDRVLVCRLCTTIGGVDRGDVVVFSDGRDYIKRVIGLPGDVVELHDGTLFRNGARVEEPYLAELVAGAPYGPVRVPDGMLFVLGDNRARSGDSRFEPPRGVGLVQLDSVIGEALLKVWPPDRIGSL